MIAASRILTQDAPPVSAVDEDAFFTNIITSNGVWKTTQHHRLDAINALVFAIIARKRLMPRVVMDIGVSSGITTLEWFNQFAAAGFPVDMIATDRSMTAYIIGIAPGLKALVEPGGYVLQAEVAGFGFRPWCSRRDYVLGNFLWKRTIAAFIHAKLAVLSLPLRSSSTDKSLHGPVKLVTSALRSSPKVKLLDDDILQPNDAALVGSADIIRLANVVQNDYFSAAEIATIVRTVRERCRGAGSLVVICRNVGDALNGSVLSLTETGAFALEERIGTGSEAERAFLDA